MRLSPTFFLFLPSVFAVLDIGDIRREDIHLPKVQGASSCFEGSEKPAFCLMKAIRNACPYTREGETYVNLTCLRTNIGDMCEKQYDSHNGNYDECLNRLNLASLSVTRDQCPTEKDVFSCYIHEAYYLCDEKFDCVSDSLEKICSDGCLSWKKATYTMKRLKNCEGKLDCIDVAVNEGCGKDLDCAVPVISTFCDLINKSEKEATRCLLMIHERITNKTQRVTKPRGPAPTPARSTYTTTRKATIPTAKPWIVVVPEPQRPYIPLPFPHEPSFPAPLPGAPTWPGKPYVPIDRPNIIIDPIRPVKPVIQPVEPIVASGDNEVSSTAISEESNANYYIRRPTSTTPNPLKIFQTYHVIIICCALGAIAVTVVGILGWMYCNHRREKKRRQRLIDAEKAKKSAEMSSKKDTSRRQMSRVETSRTETMKEASKSEASKKEISRKEEKTEKSTASEM